MKARRAGLISAGGASHSLIARLPPVLREIGLVKATTFRVARRIANSLRAGDPVEHYSDLHDHEPIWVAVPETALDAVMRDLSAERIEGKMIIVCGTPRDSGSLHALRPARVATLGEIDERILIAEGHADALREVRRVAAASRRKLIEIAPGSKPLCFAGVNVAALLLLPFMASAVEGLRHAGFPRVLAASVAEGLGTRALRAYGKAGRKAWNDAAGAELRESLMRDLESIRKTDPRMADVYETGIELALRHFGTTWAAEP
jgi:hypothetical protein